MWKLYLWAARMKKREKNCELVKMWQRKPLLYISVFVYLKINNDPPNPKYQLVLALWVLDWNLVLCVFVFVFVRVWLVASLKRKNIYSLETKGGGGASPGSLNLDVFWFS